MEEGHSRRREGHQQRTPMRHTGTIPVMDLYQGKAADEENDLREDRGRPGSWTQNRKKGKEKFCISFMMCPMSVPATVFLQPPCAAAGPRLTRCVLHIFIFLPKGVMGEGRGPSVRLPGATSQPLAH